MDEKKTSKFKTVRLYLLLFLITGLVFWVPSLFIHQDNSINTMGTDITQNHLDINLSNDPNVVINQDDNSSRDSMQYIYPSSSSHSMWYDFFDKQSNWVLDVVPLSQFSTSLINGNMVQGQGIKFAYEMTLQTKLAESGDIIVYTQNGLTPFDTTNYKAYQFRPYVYLPAKLYKGETWKYNFSPYSNITAKILGFASVKTPLGQFENCAVINRQEIFSDAADTQFNQVETEIYAPNVGLVKLNNTGNDGKTEYVLNIRSLSNVPVVINQ